MHQPGARWMYNTGSLLQGRAGPRASGQDFDTFVEERVLAPLGMRDTGFFVPAAKLDRFAGCGSITDPQSGKPSRMDADGAQSAYASHRYFRPARPALSPPSTTTSRLPACCWTAACTRAGAC